MKRNSEILFVTATTDNAFQLNNNREVGENHVTRTQNVID